VRYSTGDRVCRATSATTARARTASFPAWVRDWLSRRRPKASAQCERLVTVSAKARLVLISDLYEGGNSAPNDDSRSAYHTNHAAALAAWAPQGSPARSIGSPS